LALGGASSIISGVLIAISPVARAFVIALWVGAYAFVFGVILVALGFRLRRWRDSPPSRVAVPDIGALSGSSTLPKTVRNATLQCGGPFMRRILYTMHFVGRTSPVPENSTVLRTRGTATSCVITTVLSPSGLKSDLKGSAGDLAFLESELRLNGGGEFQEMGQITFADECKHVLEFSTLGRGHVVCGIEPGLIAGSASWLISGGIGQFAGAQGVISSTFTINESGDRNDLHCGLIFIPE
jgi:hypothetical protein